MGTQPNRHSDLSLVGALPLDLDGLLLLLALDDERGDVVLNALRLGAGRSLWYASVAQLTTSGADEQQTQLGSLVPPASVGSAASWRRAFTSTSFTRRLRVRRAGETALAWSLHEERGAPEEEGQVGVERAREIADILVTDSYLVLLSLVHRNDVPRYQVGLAARKSRARVHWLSEEHEGYPELLHAHEDATSVRLAIAVRTEREASSARIVRCSIDPVTLLCRVQALLEHPIAWPSVSGDAHGARHFLCGIGERRADGASSAPLIMLDLHSGELQTRSFGFARKLGAPAIVVGRALAGAARRAFVLLPVYDAVRDCTDCCALDVDALSEAPCAVIRLPPIRTVQNTRWIESQRFRLLDSVLSSTAQSLR